MKFLLDTNVLSELRKDQQGHPAVLAWADEAQLAKSAISAITIMEIAVGVRRIARHDADQAERLHIWLHQKVRPKFNLKTAVGCTRQHRARRVMRRCSSLRAVPAAASSLA